MTFLPSFLPRDPLTQIESSSASPWGPSRTQPRHPLPCICRAPRQCQLYSNEAHCPFPDGRIPLLCGVPRACWGGGVGHSLPPGSAQGIGRHWRGPNPTPEWDPRSLQCCAAVCRGHRSQEPALCTLPCCLGGLIECSDVYMLFSELA